MQANSILGIMDSQALTAACSRQAESETPGWRPSWAPDWRRTSWYVSLECRQRLVPHSLVPGNFHIHFPPRDEMFYETIYCFLNMYVLRTIGKNSVRRHSPSDEQTMADRVCTKATVSMLQHNSVQQIKLSKNVGFPFGFLVDLFHSIYFRNWNFKKFDLIIMAF